MSTISSGTTLTTALVQTGDTTGDLVIKTGSSNTTAMTISGSNQSVTFAGAVNVASTAFANGSASAPSITFTGDTNTGIFSPAADTIGFAEGGAEVMRISSSGFVGINTTNPQERFDVNGNIQVGYTASGQYVDVYNGDTTNYQRLRLSMSGNNAFITTRRSSGTVPQMLFGIDNTEVMRIDTSGNVGIGTSSPASDARLTVSSPNTESYVFFQRSNSGVFDTAVGNSGGSTVFRGGADSSTVAGLTEFMRIDSTGNVGIGTSSPGMRLELGGSFGGMRVRNTTDVPGFTDIQQSYSGVPELRIGSAVGNDTTAAIRIRQGNAGDVLVNGNFLFNSGYGSAATAYGCRAWVNFNGTGTVAIRASGNVSSITDNGVGDYTINFAIALPDGNYSVIGVGSNAGLDYRATISPRANSGTAPSSFLLTTSARVSAVGLSSTFTDVETGCISIHR
jgi:hypothetical protein